MTGPYYLRRFLQFEGKQRCIFLQVSICKQGHFHMSSIEESPFVKTIYIVDHFKIAYH